MQGEINEPPKWLVIPWYFIFVIAGSKKNDFSELSPEEAEKELGKMVDQMDKDNDKYVTKQELLQWISRSFR